MYFNSKRQLDNILCFCESKLKIISNNSKLNGFIVFLFHFLIQLVIFYFLFLYPVGVVFYIVSCSWVIIMTFNFYFHGCILTKLERKLWNTKQWHGLFFFCYNCDDLNLNLSTTFMDNLFICKIICITTIIFLRILFNY